MIHLIPVETASEPLVPTPSQFPTEICEGIIDACSEYHDAERDVTGVYSSLYACSLVCRAWYPRSRVNLYHHVKLTGSIPFNNYYRTLLENPSYSDFTHGLSIAVNLMAPGRFVSAGTILVAFCRRLKNLDRIDVIYTSMRPHTNFWICCRQYHPVTVLSLYGYTFETTKDLVKFITSFSNLHTLKVVYDDYDAPEPSKIFHTFYEVDLLPHLTTVQMEVVSANSLRPQAASPPVPRANAPHILYWLARSPIAKHLRRAWILYTIDGPGQDKQSAQWINRLLDACGESLQELAVSIQITSDAAQGGYSDNLDDLTLKRNPNLRHLHLFRMPWKAIPTFFPSLVISASKSSLESVSLTLTDRTWARRGKPLTPPTQDEYWLFTEVDHALVNNFPRFRELAIDLCGTLPDGDDKVLKSLPKANALGHVRLGDIDENQLRLQWGLP